MRFPATLVRVSEEAVKRGANRLDHRRPNWYKQITCKTLDLSSSCDCVIGQLYGNYEMGFLSRVLNNIAPWKVYNAGTSHGFCLSNEGVEWAEAADKHGDNFIAFNRRWTAAYHLLDRLWLAEIKKRRDRDTRIEEMENRHDPAIDLTQVAA